MKYRRRAVEVEATRQAFTDGHVQYHISHPFRRIVSLEEFERDFEPLPEPPAERGTPEILSDARLAGFHAGREWMKQGREYVEGWRDGIKRAFAFLSERVDERAMILFREQPYSWEASSSPPSEDTNAQ